jgi:hypothetical protein
MGRGRRCLYEKVYPRNGVDMVVVGGLIMDQDSLGGGVYSFAPIVYLDCQRFIYYKKLF